MRLVYVIAYESVLRFILSTNVPVPVAVVLIVLFSGFSIVMNM